MVRLAAIAWSVACFASQAVLITLLDQLALSWVDVTTAPEDLVAADSHIQKF